MIPKYLRENMNWKSLRIFDKRTIQKKIYSGDIIKFDEVLEFLNVYKMNSFALLCCFFLEKNNYDFSYIENFKWCFDKNDSLSRSIDDAIKFLKTVKGNTNLYVELVGLRDCSKTLSEQEELFLLANKMISFHGSFYISYDNYTELLNYYEKIGKVVYGGLPMERTDETWLSRYDWYWHYRGNSSKDSIKLAREIMSKISGNKNLYFEVE